MIAKDSVNPISSNVPRTAGHIPSHTGSRLNKALKGGTFPKNIAIFNVGNPFQIRKAIKKQMTTIIMTTEKDASKENKNKNTWFMIVLLYGVLIYLL